MKIVSLHLTTEYSVEELEERLSLTFTRTIEKTFVAHKADEWVYFTQFDVISFVNVSLQTIERYLEALNMPKSMAMCFQESYTIKIDTALHTPYKITNSEITLQTLDPTLLTIIAHVVSQSVGLEKFEQQMDQLFNKINAFLIKEEYSIFTRRKVATLSQEIALFRHTIVLDLYLLDKPDILWENPEAEALYTALESALELRDRFKVLEYKLSSLKEDISSITELIHHKHSAFLEWIIIILIGVEIVMGLYKLF